MSDQFEFTAHQLVRHSERQASQLNLANQKLVNAKKMHQNQADLLLATAEKITEVLRVIMHNKAEYVAMVKNHK